MSFILLCSLPFCVSKHSNSIYHVLLSLYLVIQVFKHVSLYEHVCLLNYCFELWNWSWECLQVASMFFLSLDTFSSSSDILKLILAPQIKNKTEYTVSTRFTFTHRHEKSKRICYERWIFQKYLEHAYFKASYDDNLPILEHRSCN